MVENFLKKLINNNPIERKVKQRYIQIAGLIRNDEMVNKDKELRARQRVVEQEKIEFENKKKQKWWENSLVRGIALSAAILGIISFLFLKN